MILVVLGTHELPFTRLLEAVDSLKTAGKLDDEIVVQSGHTKFTSSHMKLIPFISYEELGALYDEARLIITHAGTGSVITGIKKGKKVIAAPRLEKYGEHNDDHQLQLVDEFVQAGYIVAWHDGDSLEDIIQQATTFEPKPFKSGRDQMLSIIEDFINNI
ncbi:PssE/Cps14G family polysaccharide biosynthesis glycosyltransferase [Bacillus salitolerans]|uniref:PssE/Cps14G family polysaccharide biosynthesis glycosyltransferase n=1 Tax=Bacillus salitolerans TaxID=1437434 RepID=A0ABW4LJ05_9BACI